MHLLISNDDGVYAKGLSILVDTLKNLGHISVFAPDRNRSGSSNSLTLHAPLHIKSLENGMISVEGTPTDCVHLAITGGMLQKIPDIVVAGINDGPNLGDDVWYSGTVAAAMEGRFLGIPALAVSLVGERFFYHETAAKVTKKLIKYIMKDSLFATNAILNINVPDLPYHKLKGFKVTRLGARHKSEPIIRQIDPRGHPIYWVGAVGAEQDAGPGTDFFAINNQCVSITPLRVDLTCYEAFDQLVALVEEASWENSEN
ncbi:5'/3'-nucleotidase SurE [Coxiella endosymbiont of Amblyomma americanum]|uniref:5'/3'-nucleotidase SurE n=1 Tax=Coxiella endosymbiont of Amblyomma americanum TaxID=325775 RepID=UPI00057C860B|nr:5'/3'-nucleotidase SurE [Coxiella endosymbiont of Amblyomma americanum]AJC50226.1 stationary phase survival protein SurE [Coxiella endosymbiont of Amblyomma americanum]